MKAIVCTKYGPPDVLQLKEIEKPVPKPDEVCIKIYATAVTSSDCYIRSFNFPFPLRILAGLALGYPKPRRPVLGMVLAGEIETTGKDVNRFRAGDPIFAYTGMRFGAYAEYTCLPEGSVMALKPSNATYEEAAAVPYGGLLALHFLRSGKIRSGQKVLIDGASGAVGTSAVQLARYFGAEVTGVCSTANLELVRSLGAETVIDYTREDFTKRGDLYDFIFDGVPKGFISLKGKIGKITKSDCMKALAPGGVYVSVDQGTPKMLTQNLTLLKELVETGRFKAVIDRRYPMEQIAEAHSYVDQGHKKGNVIVNLPYESPTTVQA